MKDRPLGPANTPLLLGLAIATSLAVIALAVYGYRAVREWEHSATALADRASQDGADLLVTALTRDMRGAQALILANRDAGDYATQAIPDFSGQVAAAFTRFPYPESFFGWRRGDRDLVFFNRATRAPAWAADATYVPHYPVVATTAPDVGGMLLSRIRLDAMARRAYSDFRIRINDVPYEIVARLQYADPFRDRVDSVTGFTVNLSWARQRYFSEIVSQVSRIAGAGLSLEYAVVDDSGAPVAGNVARDGAAVRTFPLQFFDPSTSERFANDEDSAPNWTVRVRTVGEPGLLLTAPGAGWTPLAIGVTTLALLLSFFLLAHALRAGASLAAMRSDFVSSVTHELKTPIATIRAIADTLARGRLDGAGIREYAGLLVQESRRLTRLVDNLLAYARVTDVAEAYSYERVEPAELIEESITGFQRQLTDGRFDVVTDVPNDLPLVRGDRTALRLALDNLIDNAIRYSGESRWIRVGARPSHAAVTIEVSDRGAGIPADELERVQRKFVRGRGIRTHGSGLGLAIVKRVAEHHAATFELRSEVGVGTTARVDLPVFSD